MNNKTKPAPIIANCNNKSVMNDGKFINFLYLHLQGTIKIRHTTTLKFN